MGDVSDLAGKSENFANFLTVSRKFGFTCVYIFHTINPTKENWQTIISQTKMFNIFQATSVIKVLYSYCSRYTYEYIPQRDLWLNQLYFDISNSGKK